MGGQGRLAESGIRSLCDEFKIIVLRSADGRQARSAWTEAFILVSHVSRRLICSNIGVLVSLLQWFVLEDPYIF